MIKVFFIKNAGQRIFMRGFWYMVEAVMVSVMLMSFLYVVGSKYTSVVQPQNLAEKGFLVLKGLDDRGELKNYTVAMDYTGLNSIIPVYNYNHTVEICNAEGTCAGHKPVASNIWTASYITAGEYVYKPLIVRLYFSPLD